MQSRLNNSLPGSPSSWTAYLELFIFLLIGCIGVYAALLTGISYDEGAEFRTYSTNLEAIRGLLKGNSDAYIALTQYFDRYYGIGFHIFSYGFAYVLNHLGGDLLLFSSLGSRLIWGHLTVFLSFMSSGLLVRGCLLLLTKDRLISSLGMFTFLLWPYVFGHALMNVKDVPFMFGWLCCTYLALRLFLLPAITSKSRLLYLMLLGALTGWLTSIRVAGVLIYIEYFWMAIFWMFGNRNTAYFIVDSKQLVKTLSLIFAFFISFFLVLYSFYPILWFNPIELLNAISYMGSHPWQGDTLTAGELVEPKTRLIFYIASWLLVKLPLFSILGLITVTYFSLRNLFNHKLQLQEAATWALSLTVITIIGLLIIQRAALYNDLRQILFVMPLLLMISIIGFFWISKKACTILLSVTACLMLIDDIHLQPYQYTYVNEMARYTNVGKKYETDYFGVSVKEIAHWLNGSTVDGNSQCLYVPASHLWGYEINPKKFPCVQGFPGDLSLIKEPFLFFVQARSVTNFRPMPWCHLLHFEERVMPFSDAKMRMGELYQCLPPKIKASINAK